MNWEVELADGVLFIRPTFKGRVVSALKRGVAVGGAIAVLASAYFLISLLGPNPISWKIQVLGGLILGIFLGLMIAIARFGRVDMWVFDRPQGVLVWESRAIGSKPRNVAFALEDLRKVEAQGDVLEVTWENGTKDILAHIGDPAGAAQFAKQINSYVW